MSINDEDYCSKSNFVTTRGFKIAYYRIMITNYHVIDAQDLKPQRFVAITFNEYVINYHSI